MPLHASHFPTWIIFYTSYIYWNNVTKFAGTLHESRIGSPIPNQGSPTTQIAGLSCRIQYPVLPIEGQGRWEKIEHLWILLDQEIYILIVIINCCRRFPFLRFFFMCVSWWWTGGPRLHNFYVSRRMWKVNAGGFFFLSFVLLTVFF